MHLNSVSTFILSALAATLLVSVSAKPYAAAKCLAKGVKCSRPEAKRAELCTYLIDAFSQSSECHKEACSYCLQKAIYQTKFPCDSPAVAQICGYNTFTPTPSATPSATPSISSSISPSPSISPSISPSPPPIYDNSCIWTGTEDRDDVVVDLARVEPHDGWTRCYRDGYFGLVYKKERNLGIDWRGRYGNMCFDIYPKHSGTYFLTALSYAPHNTEHNDVWVRSSKGFELWKWGTMDSYVDSKQWLKAYQNYGTKGIAHHFKTIDWNGHRLLIPNVNKDEVFQVCLSGRSFRYEMFRLALIKCTGKYCTGHVYHDIKRRTPSQCIAREDE